MPAPYSVHLRWRVIWFVHILQNSVAETFEKGQCMERYISKFSANGHVKLGPVRRSYSSISFAPREELIVFANQIWKPLFLSGVQFLFDDCHSPLSPTTFFEIGVCSLDVHSQSFYFLELDQTTNRKLRYSVFFFSKTPGSVSRG